MALSKQKKKQQDAMNTFTIVEVRRCHDFGNGQISFDATFDNTITVYGMKYIEGVKKNGDEYAFISFPQIKGQDGNYYNRAYAIITPELQDAIVSQLEKMLTE